MSRGGFRTPPIMSYETLCKNSQSLQVVKNSPPGTTDRAPKPPLISESSPKIVVLIQAAW